MTKIEWATHTSNWLAGCTKVSPACSHCYAETMSARLATMPHAPQRYRDGVVEGRRWTGEVSYDRDALQLAFADLLGARWPRRVFINSMSDTFHVDAPPESLAHLAQYIRSDRYGGAIGSTGHVIMLLTKRPDRMLAWQREHFHDGLPAWVWVGCTVEDQRRADERVPVLLQVQTAGVRFLSVEPLLGPVCLPYSAFNGSDSFGAMEGIGWVIAGCESGAGRRETSVEWVRALRDDCAAAAVPFFLKQLYVDGKKVGLPELDGVVHAAVPSAS
jgi:protein gp37